MAPRGEAQAVSNALKILKSPSLNEGESTAKPFHLPAGRSHGRGVASPGYTRRDLRGPPILGARQCNFALWRAIRRASVFMPRESNRPPPLQGRSGNLEKAMHLLIRFGPPDTTAENIGMSRELFGAVDVRSLRSPCVHLIHRRWAKVFGDDRCGPDACRRPATAGSMSRIFAWELVGVSRYRRLQTASEFRLDLAMIGGVATGTLEWQIWGGILTTLRGAIGILI